AAIQALGWVGGDSVGNMAKQFRRASMQLAAFGSERQPDDNPIRLVTCRLDQLQPHPSCVRHHLTVPVSQLSALAERGDLAFREALAITSDGTIIDGYARFELARLQGRPTLLCLQYEL